MKLHGAVVKEQGATFAVLVAKPHILNSNQLSEEFIEFPTAYFPNIPIVLMAQYSKGIPTYSGRRDIVKFLTNIHLGQIPWREYTIS